MPSPPSFLSLLVKFWVIVAAVVTAAYFLGDHVGYTRFDTEKNKLVADTAALNSKIKALKVRLTYISDSIRIANPPVDTNDLVVMHGGSLPVGFDMGIDTRDHVAGWVKKVADAQVITYPGGQPWGAVFITVGKPADLKSRSFKDFSKYHRVSFELNATPGERVLVGLKSNTDPDYGAETRYPIAIVHGGWSTYTVNLSEFTSADLKHLYVVTEFVFGLTAQTVSVRSIKYLK